jgi:hypothetical protein
MSYLFGNLKRVIKIKLKCDFSWAKGPNSPFKIQLFLFMSDLNLLDSIKYSELALRLIN